MLLQDVPLALVGGTYASGHLSELETWVNSLTWKEIVKYLDMSIFRGGVIKGEKLLDSGLQYMKGHLIETLDIPFATVATDLQSGCKVEMKEGLLVDAVRASISLPGLFTPMKHEGRWLVDGGLVDPVPVSLCRALGADVVIAVNLNAELVGKDALGKYKTESVTHADTLWDKVTDQWKSKIGKDKIEILQRWIGETSDCPSMFEVMYGSINIMQDKITRSRLAEDPADIVIEPKLGHIGLMEYDQAEEAIKEGRASVKRFKAQILELV